MLTGSDVLNVIPQEANEAKAGVCVDTFCFKSVDAQLTPWSVQLCGVVFVVLGFITSVTKGEGKKLFLIWSHQKAYLSAWFSGSVVKMWQGDL